MDPKNKAATEKEAAAPKDAKKNGKADTPPVKSKEYLECKLTKEEIAAAAKTLAEAIQRRTSIEARIEAFRTQAKADIAEIDAVVNKHSSLVHTEREFRSVECETTFYWKAGTKKLVRKDTGEVIRVTEISNEERQQQLV